MEALDSENLLDVSFSLFNDIVFEPRNRGVHKYELVGEHEAKHGYDLAVLTIRNCVHRVSPAEAPVLYGNIVACKGEDAIRELGRPKGMLGNDLDPNNVFFLKSVGDPGDHAVLIDRAEKDGKISVLKVVGDDKLESRYSLIRGNFSSKQLRSLYHHLELTQPSMMDGYGSAIKFFLDGLRTKTKQ